MMGDRARLLASVALCALAWMPAAMAGQDGTAAQIAQARTQRFDIPAQPLASALTAFAQSTGLRLAYGADLATGRASPGVQGEMSAEDALKRLLAGSGLTWRFSDARTVTLEKMAADGAMTLDPVTVEGQAAQPETALGPVQGYVASRAITATKTDAAIIETPQSISVITRDQMDAQKAQSLGEVLRYSAGISGETFGLDTRQDWLFIRGFEQTQQGLYRDGLQLRSYSYATWRSEPYGAERVEVLRGPASILFGQGGPGGLVNTVSKRPTEQAFHELEFQAGTNDRVQGAFDFSGPVTADKSLLYRVTGLVRDGDTPVDYVGDQRTYLAPALTWKNDDTKVTLLAQYQEDHTGSTNNWLPASGTFLANPNGNISRHTFAGEPNWDTYDKTQYSIGYEVEHQVNDALTLRQNARYAHLDLNYKSMYATGFASSTSPMLNRGAFASEPESESIAVDTNGQLKFRTGPVDHTVLAGVDYNRYFVNNRTGYGLASAINIYNPTYGYHPDVTLGDEDLTQNQIGVYVQDQLKLHDKWVLLLSGRQDWASTERDNKQGTDDWDQDDHAFSGRAGLLYQSETGLSPYVSYSESFLPVMPSNGQPFKPEKGKQYEVGVKYQPKGWNSYASVAAYELTRKNVTTPDPSNPTLSVQTGEQRTRGLEFEALANLAEGLNLIGSVTLMDAEITKSNTAGEQGKRPYAVPEHMASLWADYSIADGPLAGFGAGAGVRYVGSAYVDNQNSLEVPDYTLVDGALSYTVDDNWRLALNGSNLLDKRYVASCGGGSSSCYYGAGRTVIGSVRYRW